MTQRNCHVPTEGDYGHLSVVGPLHMQQHPCEENETKCLIEETLSKLARVSSKLKESMSSPHTWQERTETGSNALSSQTRGYISPETGEIGAFEDLMQKDGSLVNTLIAVAEDLFVSLGLMEPGELRYIILSECSKLKKERGEISLKNTTVSSPQYWQEERPETGRKAFTSATRDYISPETGEIGAFGCGDVNGDGSLVYNLIAATEDLFAGFGLVEPGELRDIILHECSEFEGKSGGISLGNTTDWHEHTEIHGNEFTSPPEGFMSPELDDIHGQLAHVLDQNKLVVYIIIEFADTLFASLGFMEPGQLRKIILRWWSKLRGKRGEISSGKTTLSSLHDLHKEKGSNDNQFDTTKCIGGVSSSSRFNCWKNHQ